MSNWTESEKRLSWAADDPCERINVAVKDVRAALDRIAELEGRIAEWEAAWKRKDRENVGLLVRIAELESIVDVTVIAEVQGMCKRIAELESQLAKADEIGEKMKDAAYRACDWHDESRFGSAAREWDEFQEARRGGK